MSQILNIKNISRFWIIDFWKKQTNENYISNNSICLNWDFWDNIYNKKFLTKFLLEDYLQFKKNNVTKQEHTNLKRDIHFLLDKIDLVKWNINLYNDNKIPKWEDIFFSFRVFSLILYYVNDFFSNEEIYLWLREGIVFKKKKLSLNDLIKNIEFYSQTNFIEILVEPIVKKIIKKNQKLYIFEIFWPYEIILVWVISQIIKNINKEARVCIDFSIWNEQFDFNQWIELIKKWEKNFFDFFDFFIVNNDFWDSKEKLLSYINWNIDKEKISNIILYDKKVYYSEIEDMGLSYNIFTKFLDQTFNYNNIYPFLWKKWIYSRLLPYKCYWSNCNFCAINSQNKFSYNSDYSYDFFIDKWISFIKKFNIYSLNFKDEAIPPKVILKFAYKIIENNLNVNYQFRTRYDNIFTLKNCKILAQSWCWYCGVWLESAVDRVNEKIANKWNYWITINDKIKIIHNFDKAWISFHNYSIIWFPWETDVEILTTYKFLKNNIIKSNYFTCTPNIFWLMKWTKIFRNSKKMWLELDKNDLNDPFMLNYNFTEKGKKRNFILFKKVQEKLHRTQFLPWLSKESKIDWKAFWDYMDRSYIFYLLKRFSNCNPFLKYKRINNKILKRDYNYILKQKYNLAYWLQFFSYDKEFYIYDWCGDYELKFDNDYMLFFKNYNQELTLEWNIKLNISMELENTEFIYKLLKNRMLFLK